jgi:GTP pyrophosphokinase
MGKGITVHRRDCPNVRALMRNPERFTPVEWDGGASQSFRVHIAVHAWDRSRLLEDVARTFAEHGANIVSYGGTVEDQLAKNWYVAELGDVKSLRGLLSSLRGVEAVFDSYRVTPSCPGALGRHRICRRRPACLAGRLTTNDLGERRRRGFVGGNMVSPAP